MRRGVLLILLVAAGCGRHAEVAGQTPGTKPPREAPADPWVLTCLDPNANEPAWLSNGLIGIRVGRDGTGSGQPFFAIDEYGASGEEKIRPLPSPLSLKLTIGSQEARPAGGTDYRQTLDMRTGEIHTSWKQGGGDVDLAIYVDPARRLIAQRIQISSTVGVEVASDEAIEGGSSAVRGDAARSEGELTQGGIRVETCRAVEGGEATWKGFAWSVRAKAGTPIVLYRTVALGESPNFATMVAARNPSGAAPKIDRTPPRVRDAKSGLEQVRDACRQTWAKRWKTDIQIDGPVEDQQAVRSFLFYLQMAIHPQGRMAVSPMALSNAQYNGHVFWDADVWVFPAMALVNPAEAKAIPNYRLAMQDQAVRNAGSGGAKYPWESSVSGKETVPGPSRKELHITGSVLWGLRQAAALGLADGAQVEKLAARAAAYYRSITQNGQIKDVMSPDENHIGDNDLYTNLLAQGLTGQPYKLPKDDQTFLTYDGDPLRGYKQAAAILAIYPLQYGPAEKQAKAMMSRLADKVTSNGPAMSESVDATIWARTGESEKAYAAWGRSWRDFTRNPLLLFSEKRKKPVTYFVTGAGGSLQSVLYGFLGFRLDSKAEPGSVWSMKLEGEHYLSVRPHLPAAWRSVKFTNFSVLGRRFSLTATPNGASVSSGE